jgi:class 3 adenylate cyclase
MMAGLERLIQGTRQVQDGHGYEMLPVTSNDEIGKLTVAFNHMVEDLRAKDRIKETFGKFVDPRIVANLLDPAGGKDLAERQVATVFFSDIKGFSGLGELLTATTLVKLLNTYFSEMTAAIHARNGIIDKFVGDGLMAFWTAPFSRGESHATDACLAALAQQRAIRELREHLSDVLGLRRDLPEFSVRMGLATGDLVVGTIGSTEARSFTVIGYCNRRYRQPCFAPRGCQQSLRDEHSGRRRNFPARPKRCRGSRDRFSRRTGKGRTRARLRDHRTCRMPFRRRATVVRLVRRGAGGLSRPGLGPVGAVFCSVSGGHANGRAAYGVPSAHQAPARQDPPDGLGRGLAADRQVIRGA